MISSCAQVLCTNASDHFCDECESNYGLLLGQRAYTNLGTECEGTGQNSLTIMTIKLPLPSISSLLMAKGLLLSWGMSEFYGFL